MGLSDAYPESMSRRGADVIRRRRDRIRVSGDRRSGSVRSISEAAIGEATGRSPHASNSASKPRRPRRSPRPRQRRTTGPSASTKRSWFSLPIRESEYASRGRSDEGGEFARMAKGEIRSTQRPTLAGAEGERRSRPPDYWSTNRFPTTSTRKVASGPIRVVDSGSSTMAGPATLSSVGSFVRSYTSCSMNVPSA